MFNVSIFSHSLFLQAFVHISPVFQKLYPAFTALTTTIAIYQASSQHSRQLNHASHATWITNGCLLHPCWKSSLEYHLEETEGPR